MTYLRPHSRNRGSSAKGTLIVFLIIIFAIVAGIQIISPHVFPALFHSVALPFWRTEFSVVNGALASREDLLSENESLRRRLADYEIQYASSTLELLYTQNSALLSMFGRASTSPTNYKLAAVLSRPSFVPYDEIIIDLGSEQGVSSSSLVYSPGQVPIGRVLYANPKTAIVSLFTSPKESYNVLIGSTLLQAVAIGQGGGQYRAEVPHGAEVQAGDVVVDSILNSRPFGEVVSVSSDPANPFDYVLIAPPINIFDIPFVLVK